MTSKTRYVAAHIFYNVYDFRPLFVECLNDLVHSLEERGYIDSFFFIRYWFGGPHIRLRLLPAHGVTEAELRGQVEPCIQGFMERLPSLFDLDPAKANLQMRKLFEDEYGTAALHSQFGEDGQMPIFPNNSLQFLPYEPEYDKYGGEAGVTLAERHFEHSSRHAMRVLADTNSHIAAILLGQGLQTMLHLAHAFFPDRSELADFFEKYSIWWRRRGNLPEQVKSNGSFDRAYQNQKERLREHLSRLRSIGNCHDDEVIPDSMKEWYTRSQELHHSVSQLWRDGDLTFGRPLDSEREAHVQLLGNYIHMTNNRLGVTIPNEAYLAYVLSRALRETHA